MGFWDQQVAALSVAGFDLTPEQVAALETGGYMITLMPLPDPIHLDHGCGSPSFDTQGKPAMLAVPFRTHAPDEVYCNEPPTNYAQFAESEWAASWREWPTYLGEVEMPLDFLYEQTLAIRAWAAEPADGGRIDRFRRAANRAVTETGYDTLRALWDLEQEAYELEGWGDPEEIAENKAAIAGCLKDLRTIGCSDGEMVTNEPAIPPFEDLLDDPGDKNFHRLLVWRSRQANITLLSGISPAERAQHTLCEGAFNPWY